MEDNMAKKIFSLFIIGLLISYCGPDNSEQTILLPAEDPRRIELSGRVYLGLDSNNELRYEDDPGCDGCASDGQVKFHGTEVIWYYRPGNDMGQGGNYILDGNTIIVEDGTKFELSEDLANIAGEFGRYYLTEIDSMP